MFDVSHDYKSSERHSLSYVLKSGAAVLTSIILTRRPNSVTTYLFHDVIMYIGAGHINALLGRRLVGQKWHKGVRNIHKPKTQRQERRKAPVYLRRESPDKGWHLALVGNPTAQFRRRKKVVVGLKGPITEKNATLTTPQISADRRGQYCISTVHWRIVE
jgi:hypothetical protein